MIENQSNLSFEIWRLWNKSKTIIFRTTDLKSGVRKDVPAQADTNTANQLAADALAKAEAEN